MILNTFPFQDLPQHLAYAKIFKDFENVSIFGEYYQYSDNFNSYHLPYYFLKALQFLFSTIIAFKFMFIFYGFLIFLSIKKLRSVIYNETNHYISLILAVILSWNSVFFMGFLQYSLTLPFLIYGFAFLYDYLKKGDHKDLIKYFSSLLIVSCIHVFATGTLFIISSVLMFIYKNKKLIAINTFGSFFLLLIFGGFLSGKSSGKSFSIFSSFDGAFGFEFINHIFNLKWSHLPTIANYLTWNFLTPVPLGILLIGFIFTVLFVFKREASFYKNDLILPSLFKYLFVISMLLPWALYKPTEITFINYRFTGIVIALFFASLSEDHFNKISTKNFFPFVLGFKFLTIIYILINFQITTSGVFQVINSIPKGKVLHTVIYQNQTEYTSKMFRIQHFLPMYYTVLRDGVSTQFWAGYTSHLPIGYQQGKKPRTAPDWHPKKTTTEDIKRFDYHLIREPKENNSGYFTIKNELNDQFKVLANYKDWTAYERK